MPYNSPFAAIRARQLPDQITLIESASVDNPGGTQALGQVEFAGANLGKAGSILTFGAVMSVSDGALTGTVQLYNVTDGEAVTSAVLTTSSVAPAAQEVTVATGAGAGEFKLGTRIYEVRISVTGAGPTDILSVGSAYLKVSAP